MSDTVEQWDFTYEPGGTLPLRSAVFQALGGASACWEYLAEAGEFNSDRCAQIGEKLMAYLNGEDSVLNARTAAREEREVEGTHTP